MATSSGRLAAIKLGANLVRGIGKWDLDMSRKEVDTGEFGQTWDKFDVAFGSWKGSFSGHVHLDDAQQDTLRAAFKDGSLITDIRFYLDMAAGKYYAPDLATDPEAGCRITSLKVGTAKDNVGTLDIAVSGSGPIDLFG